MSSKPAESAPWQHALLLWGLVVGAMCLYPPHANGDYRAIWDGPFSLDLTRLLLQIVAVSVVTFGLWAGLTPKADRNEPPKV